MDYESSDSRSKGCWDPAPILDPFNKIWTTNEVTHDFVVDENWRGAIVSIGFAGSASPEVTEFWHETLKQVYKGDEGRKKVRMAALCLATRDGLLLRLSDVKCPVYWLQVSNPSDEEKKFNMTWCKILIYSQGTADIPYNTKVQEEQLKLFTNSPETKLKFIEGGHHYLNATNPKEVNEAILEFVTKHK